MKNRTLYTFIGLIIFAGIIMTGCAERNANSMAERTQPFNTEWKFIRDSVVGAEIPEYDDLSWRTVDIPHDWSIEDLPGADSEDQIGPFSKNSPGNGNSTGHVIGGTGWYRKVFTLDKEDEGKTAILNFDGVYMESEIWVNGKKAGIHKNGYTPFWFNITSLLNPAGESNVIAVKVDNNGRNSRWYSGSGIYRNVHLTLTQPVHVAVWGVNVTTPEINQNKAIVDFEVTAKNENAEAANTQVTINIKDEEGRLVGTIMDAIEIAGKSDGTIKRQITVEDPALWSMDSPDLYSAQIILETDNEVSDVYNQTFGIRSIEFSSEKGFLLNGESVLLKGGCIHHDNGLLGAAAFNRAEERKVELLKENGFNAIRFSHNPPSESFLNACDRLGMLVINEFTDMWENYKNPQDYSVYFKEWWDRDLTDWMMRDRNHPSIIMWSIGNEIFEPDASTRLRIGEQLAERVRELDNTRAVTMGVTGFFYPKGWETTVPMFDLMDVSGYNYMLDEIESDHQKYPERVIYTSESYTATAYDYWKAVEKYPYVIGDFIWTAWDYLGEVSIGASSYVPANQGPAFTGNFSGISLPEGVNIFDLQVRRPSNWPNYLANCGDIDIIGEKNPQMLYRDVIWGNSKLEINVHEPIPEGMVDASAAWAWPLEFPHWNWGGSEDQPLQVRVFTQMPEVRLELNGKVVGQKTLTDEDKYIAVFEVPYQSGELKAICLENGEEVASKTLKTTGDPAAIRLIAERSEINANRNEVVFVKIEVVDEFGQIVPTDTVKIELAVSGNGEIIASGNASSDGMESLNKSVVKVYGGKAQVIVRPLLNSGEIKIYAESKDLDTGEVRIVTY